MTDTLQYDFELDLIPLEYEQWQEKQQKSIKYCGYVKIKENPKNGVAGSDQWFCGESDCPYCGPKIREDMYKALSGHGPLRKVVLTGDNTEKERARLMRKYGGKDNLSVFAQDVLTDKGITTQIEVLIKTDDDIGELYDEVKWEDVERWSQKSFYCKKSGNLHKTKPSPVVAKKEETDEKPVKVPYEEWIVDPKHKHEVKIIEREVIAETKGLDPKTLDELKEAMIARREVRKNKFAEYNIVILAQETLYTTVKMSEVNWKWIKNKL